MHVVRRDGAFLAGGAQASEQGRSLCILRPRRQVLLHRLTHTTQQRALFRNLLRRPLSHRLRLGPYLLECGRHLIERRRKFAVQHGHQAQVRSDGDGALLIAHQVLVVEQYAGLEPGSARQFERLDGLRYGVGQAGGGRRSGHGVRHRVGEGDARRQGPQLLQPLHRVGLGKDSLTHFIGQFGELILIQQ